MANPNAKPPAPLVGHKPDCPCPVCSPPRRGRSTRVVRLPTELVEWAEHWGGVAEVLRQMKGSG